MKYLQKVDSMLCTKSLNQFCVHWFIDTVAENAQVSLSSAKVKKDSNSFVWFTHEAFTDSGYVQICT